MSRTTVIECHDGYRLILGTEHPRTKRVVRDQRTGTGRKPIWILETICNGVAESSVEYDTKRAALEAFGGTARGE